MKIIKIIPVTLMASALAFTAISCGDKKVAQDRADEMNQDSNRAMDQTDQMASDTEKGMQDKMTNSQEMVMQEKDSMQNKGMNEMDEVSDDMSMGMEKMVGGAMMSPRMTIVENASKANNLTTLVAAVKAADLAQTLQGSGPFTVFAPTNDAFDNLPSGTVDMLLKPENKTKLQDILKYHVIAGKMNAADLVKEINDNNGNYELTTVNGAKLTAMMDGDNVSLKDADGNTATVKTADVEQSNGVVHIIDTVLMPGM